MPLILLKNNLKKLKLKLKYQKNRRNLSTFKFLPKSLMVGQFTLILKLTAHN